MLVFSIGVVLLLGFAAILLPYLAKQRESREKERSQSYSSSGWTNSPDREAALWGSASPSSSRSSELNSASMDELGRVLLIVVGAGLLIAGIIVYVGYSRRCPGCRKWFVREFIETITLDVSRGYGLVERRAYSGGSTWVPQSGTNPGHYETTNFVTRWKERVPVIWTTYGHRYFCPHCRHEWTVEEVEQREDFSRD